MPKRKRRTASTPGPKPSPLAYKLPISTRINKPMMDVLQRQGDPSTTLRLALIQWMLDKKHLSKDQMPE